MRRTTYKKSEESQDRVLDAAISVLAARGVTSTSIQDIATEAVGSPGTELEFAL